MNKAFMPADANTATIAATVASARVALDATSNAVRVHNAGTATAFITFGDSTVVATASRMPVASGVSETFTKGAASHVAAITASGTATLYFTSGEGM